MRILYVEDNPANVFLVKRVAKMGRHEIINFIDGGEAIRKYDDVNPDLVLMDIQLVGETSGLEVVKQLRKRGVTTPIIAVTAYAMVGDKERFIEAGCDDYLAKPLPIPRLVKIFEQYAESTKAAVPKAVEPPVTESAPASDEKIDEAATVTAATVKTITDTASVPVSSDMPTTETKTTEETSEAAVVATVTETAEVNKSDSAQVEKSPSDTASSPTHEGTASAEKPTTKSTSVVETANTKASTTEAKG
ncbi:MAG: response regulator [Anaerolineae bacterium]|nr:response regulator [Anaerolineae bacterium]MDQ7033646.1 response regulator [Anaerolineae bacterium]